MGYETVVSIAEGPTLIGLLTQNTELLIRIYYCQLFVVGVASAVFVLFLLYNFLRKFF